MNALALLLLAPWLAAAAQVATADPAQEASNEAEATPVHGIVANVSGEAITSADLQRQAQLLAASSSREMPTEELWHTARRLLAEEILLAAAARRQGLQAGPRAVEAWAERLRGGAEPPSDGQGAADGDPAGVRRRARAQRAALAELYLLHRTGLRSEQSSRVPTDPSLARLVAITPSQLREFWREHRLELDAPATVSCTVFPCPDAATAERAREVISRGGDRPPGIGPVQETFPVPDLERLFSPRLAGFLRTAAPGDIGPVISLPEGALFVRVDGRAEARTTTFAEVQGRLRNGLLQDLVGQARQVLVRQQASRAIFWPKDLFAAQAPLQDAAAGRVANPAPPP